MPRPVSRRLVTAALAVIALAGGGAAACGPRRGRGAGGPSGARGAADAASEGAARRIPRGLFWARLGEVPAGMRVQVWLDSDGERVRGAYNAAPWNGEVEGIADPDGGFLVTFRERGISREVGERVRSATLRWQDGARVLAGTDSAGRPVELVRAGFAPPELRPGVWVARWTGLPFGMAVETRITRDPDGHWRGVYQYSGAGGTRDGSFDGTLEASGALAIAWTELPESGAVARGRGRLAPSGFGLRGTYGIEGSTQGTGEWALEPLGP